MIVPVSCSRPIPILTYHQVDTPPPKGAPFRSLTVAPQVFARHMAWLKALGYRGLSMRDLGPYLSGERSGRVFGLTFDDGFRNVHAHALPVLQKLGFSATNYFVAGHLDGTNHWDAGKGVAPVPLMNAEEIRQWAAAGNEVGSHTLDHVDLPAVDAAHARAQIDGARRVLQDLIQAPVDAFCYPYGHYRTEHVEMVRHAGYGSATTTNRGRVHAGADPWQLPRVPVLRATHFASLVQKLLTTYEDARRKP